jgi:hypothetical protein
MNIVAYKGFKKIYVFFLVNGSYYSVNGHGLQRFAPVKRFHKSKNAS